jgi:hypothetical protein
MACAAHFDRCRLMASYLYFDEQRKVTKRKLTHINRPTGNLKITKYNGRSGTHEK